MTRTDKTVILIIIILPMMLFAANPILQFVSTRNYARIQEECQQRSRLVRMLWHAEHMMFEFRAIEDGEQRSLQWVITEIGEPHCSFTDVVFVYTREEAQYFPYNVVVAWPSENHHTKGILTGLNLLFNPENIPVPYWNPIRLTFTMEDFGLTYPLTITDMVDNWEKVLALWGNTGVSLTLRDAAWQYPHPWTIQPYHHQLE